MKKILRSRFFIGVVCFLLGFFVNHVLTKTHFSSQLLSDKEREERIPVTPEDYDHDRLVQAFQNMQNGMLKDFDDSFEIDMHVSGVNRKEDDQNVYYEIPLNDKEKNHELKVSVKDGMIEIKEVTPNSESERQFSIDPDLDETKADVKTLKDKILIKIPKRK